MSRRRSPRDAALIKSLRAEIRRLKKIEHAAWHALDDGEDRGPSTEGDHHSGLPVFVIDWDKFVVLAKLLPEGHP